MSLVIILSMLTLLTLPSNTKANDFDTIIGVLEKMTCETQGIGNLLRDEFSHTCIPAPFFTVLVANIISPGLYANTLLRVNINDDKLFKNACRRDNRIDPKNPVLSFSICSNTKLFAHRGKALGKTIVALAAAVLTGKDPWSSIKSAWQIKKSDYHNVYNNTKVGVSKDMADIGIPPWIPWKVTKENDKICVSTRSFAGWTPIGCKYMKEPYPISIYADFISDAPAGFGNIKNNNATSSQSSSDYNLLDQNSDRANLVSCGSMKGCYKRAYDSSKTALVMSGPLIECVKEMTVKIMISKDVCRFSDVRGVIGGAGRAQSGLFKFQQRMHTAVSALLTIYVIFFGFKMVLAGEGLPKSEMVNFIVKLIFVVYFSVGININGTGNDLDRMDGMVQWALPFLMEGMTQISSWIINASPSELCKFTDLEYPDSLGHMKLWDALDCRVSHYLGIDQIQSLVTENTIKYHDTSKLDSFSYPIPAYVYFLVPAILSGNFILVCLALMYPLLVISVAAFVINATIVCIISIVLLGVLAPLFVPLYLFEYTKGYFESWFKLLLSFMLQPMVAVTFMTVMFSVYDFGFYGTCQYESKDFDYSGANFQISSGSGDRSIRYFYIDTDWSNYTDDQKGGYKKEEKIAKCKGSLGYMLNHPFEFNYDMGSSLVNDKMLNQVENTKRFLSSESIKISPGMFFKSVEMVFEKIKTFVIALLTACFILYIMYHLSAILAEFAVDMTQGVSMSNVQIKAPALYNRVASAIKSANKSGAADKAATGGKARKGAEDLVSTANQSASDQVSTGASSGRKGAADSVSTSNPKKREEE